MHLQSNPNPMAFRLTVTMSNGGKVEREYSARFSLRRNTNNILKLGHEYFPDSVFVSLEVLWLDTEGRPFQVNAA